MNSVIALFKEKIELFLLDLIGACQFDYDYRCSIDFRKEIGKEHFVLTVHINNGDYKYIALTNLLLPQSMKKKGVSIELLNLLVNLCNQTGYDCFVTEITNDRWKEGLLKHGGVEDEVGDVIIDKNQWPKNHKPKKLKFVQVDADLILESEAEQFRSIKEKCITEVKRIFNSWQAEMNIVQQKEYIDQIIGVKDDETFFVRFNYFNINKINDLINNDQLEEYIKSHKSVGSWF